MGAEDTDRRVRTALGVLGEAVSALRGVHELCAARALGPSQILPAIESFIDSSLGLAGQMRYLFGMLTREAAASPLAPAVALIESALPRPLDTVAHAFGRSSWAKLGARERLELERAVGHAATELEAIRSLVELVYAALRPRVLELELRELIDTHRAPEALVRARHATPVAGPVPHVVTLALGIADERTITADPLVVWGLLEVLLRSVNGAGDAVIVVRPGAGGIEVEVSTHDHHHLTTQDGVVWSELAVAVGAGIEIDGAVAEAVAAQLGFAIERGAHVHRLQLPVEPPSLSRVATGS